LGRWRQLPDQIQGVDAGRIPRAQYGAIMIDEGHDFEPEWLKLVTQMVDPSTDSLLLLYDDAQAIYRKSKGLDFSLSSVGIKAAGRTSILRLNYDA
jgi:superfamily I DNA/RNA helicase